MPDFAPNKLETTEEGYNDQKPNESSEIEVQGVDKPKRNEQGPSPDELIPPVWMDKHFFELVLCTQLNCDNVQVTHLEISPATKNGDHYLSVMYRARLSYKIGYDTTGHKMSVIVKTKPFQSGIKKDTLDDCLVFKNERIIYTEAVPEMRKLLKRINDDTIFCPMLLYASDTPTEVLVLEDLVEQGYELPSGGLNREMSILALQLLAKWHACSYYLEKVQLYDCAKHNAHLFNDHTSPRLRNCLKANILAIANTLQDWDEFKNLYKHNFDIFINNFDELGLEAFSPNVKTGYNVLNHGDFHFKNIMIRTNKYNKPEIILIDLQMCNWSSPFQDLSYGLYNLMQRDIRDKERTALIQEYYQEFRNVLVLLELEENKEIPELNDLNSDIKRHGVMELFFGMGTHPMFYITRDDFDLDEYMDMDKPSKQREELFNQENVKKFVKQKFREFQERGCF